MVALDEYYPFDAGAGAGAFEDAWRQMARNWAASAVIDGEANTFSTYGDSSGVQVKVDTGDAWVNGHLGRNTAVKTVTLSTPDATNPRIDRIVLRLSPIGNTVSIEVLTGTPAGSPSAPALTRSSTQWELSLARVAVGAGVSTITAGNVTDERPIGSPYGMVRFPSTAARDLHIPSPSTGMTAQIGTVTYTHNGTSWAIPAAASQLDVYTSAGSATWTKPTNARLVRVICIGAGAGGGAGRRGATGSDGGGGSGGGSGGVSTWTFDASLLGGTESVQVGAAGTGGAQTTGNDTNGADGTDGGASYFGAWLQALGGTKGKGGTASGVQTGGTGGPGLTFDGQTGASGGADAAAATALSALKMGPGAGGGGGGTTTADSATASSAGGTVGGSTVGGRRTAISGGAAGVAFGGNGGNGSAGSRYVGGAGGGGGGDYPTAFGTSGRGGDGGGPGGGGGGGGASRNGFTAGRGGDGAAGAMYVETFF